MSKTESLITAWEEILTDEDRWKFVEDTLMESHRELEEKVTMWASKISERKTVHEWLNDNRIPLSENGKPLCLLRRLAILLGVHEGSNAG